MLGGAGGPMVLTVLDKQVKPESLYTLGGMIMRSVVVDIIGSPRHQLVEDDVVLS